eukprot:CAMPEP_0172477876 /NCGR_PEP_ID=MMETSP1066-20121228/1414_1 /TAXON_ID=671091 /ORGANISM="Coscinodiscus wailesii, Strain CCMP2513" /LENGTH=151 /DNA_ID=CAMNT_0013236877 /DNA_START=298 /DNA_END=754 /DNA_ORIENTATION=+
MDFDVLQEENERLNSANRELFAAAQSVPSLEKKIESLKEELAARPDESLYASREQLDAIRKENESLKRESVKLFSAPKSVPALEELVDEMNVKIDARDEKYAVAMKKIRQLSSRNNTPRFKMSECDILTEKCRKMEIISWMMWAMFAKKKK